MLLSAKSLKGYNVDATDGPVGTVANSYLDDTNWLLRSLVVDTREVIRGRDVLISPLSVRHIDSKAQKLGLALTRAQVDGSELVENVDARLKSTRDLLGYHIKARDETFGHVEDLLFEPESWAVRYLLIDTRNWWPGPPVLVGTTWVKHIDWSGKTVAFDVTAARIKACPPFDPTLPLSREYEADLHRHYEREGYWR